MADTSTPDVGLIQWALGGVAGTGVLAFGWLSSQLRALRETDEDGRRRIHERLNLSERADADQRVDTARRYATKADLADLRAHIDARLGQHEERMVEIIRDRPPIKGMAT